MALILDGTTIPPSSEVLYHGIWLSKVINDNIEVWKDPRVWVIRNGKLAQPGDAPQSIYQFLQYDDYIQIRRDTGVTYHGLKLTKVINTTGCTKLWLDFVMLGPSRDMSFYVGGAYNGFVGICQNLNTRELVSKDLSTGTLSSNGGIANKQGAPGMFIWNNPQGAANIYNMWYE